MTINSQGKSREMKQKVKEIKKTYIKPKENQQTTTKKIEREINQKNLTKYKRKDSR